MDRLVQVLARLVQDLDRLVQDLDRLVQDLDRLVQDLDKLVKSISCTSFTKQVQNRDDGLRIGASGSESRYAPVWFCIGLEIALAWKLHRPRSYIGPGSLVLGPPGSWVLGPGSRVPGPHGGSPMEIPPWSRRPLSPSWKSTFSKSARLINQTCVHN